MKKNLIGKAAIQEKSRELDIPMEWLLAGYVMEQLAVKLAESERGSRLLLKNPNVLGLSGCGKGSHKLYYAYLKQSGELFGKADFAAFLKNTIKWETDTNIMWSWRSHMEGSRLYVELVASLDEMSMPLELIVDSVGEKTLAHAPGEYTVRLLMENNKTRQVILYPVEEMFFDDLYEVLTKLELITDMSAYERIYETLGMMNIEGRQFQKRLESFCAGKEIGMDATRYAQMESYPAYPFMVKKWNGYLRKQRKSAPSWEEVYGRFWSFLMPVWSAGLQGMVYLGSWISELGRYLD